MQFILSSFIWELKVFIVSFTCNNAFQLKIPIVIIFKIAYVAIECWTKYVLYFLTHRTLILLWPLPSLNKWIDQCCSLAHAGAEIRLQYCIFLLGGGGGLVGDVATCMQLPGKLPFHRVFHRFWPCEKCPVHRFWDFLTHDRKHNVYTEDCWSNSAHVKTELCCHKNYS